MHTDSKPHSATAEDRFRIAIIISVMGAGVAGLGVAGWFGSPWDFAACIALAATGGVAAGVVERSKLGPRLLAAVPHVLGAVVFTVGTALYVEGRRSVWNVELLVPLGVAAVPFGIARWALQGSVKRAEAARLGLPGFLAVSAVIATPVLGWFVGAPSMEDLGKRVEATTRHELVLKMDADGNLQLDDAVLSEDQLKGLLQRAAAQHPGTQILVEVPGGVDERTAAAKMIPLTMPNGLQFATRRAR